MLLLNMYTIIIKYYEVQKDLAKPKKIFKALI